MVANKIKSAPALVQRKNVLKVEKKNLECDIR